MQGHRQKRSAGNGAERAARAARRALDRARRHAGFGQELHRPPACPASRPGIRRCRSGDRGRCRHVDRRYFRASMASPIFAPLEARVIARLLDKGPQVIATGGGAFVNADTRALVRARARIRLAQGRDRSSAAPREAQERPAAVARGAIPKAVLKRLLAEREASYGEADITVISRDVPHEAVVEAIVKALAQNLSGEHATPTPVGARP